MKKISNVALVVSKIIEVIHWIGVVTMVAFFVCTFAFREVINEIIYTEGMPLDTYGFEISSVSSDGTVSMAALRIFLVFAFMAFILMAMTFRNVYLILKKSKSSTPFQKDNVRMLKEIGIFSISIPVLGLIASIIVRLVTDVDYVEAAVDMKGFIMGILVLCLTQFFARGVELEEEVDGLV